MPKHTFRFPPEVVTSVKQHVRNAIAAVDPGRYRQEANYTAALANRLEGTAYEGKYGYVGFTSTIFDDRGRESAESKFGADCAITATISDGRTTIDKVILVQVKRGLIKELSNKEASSLCEQIRKMKQLVPAPKVMEMPSIAARLIPLFIGDSLSG